MVDEIETKETRQELREKRKLKTQQKMLHHGGSLIRIYRDAVLKQIKGKGLKNASP